MEQISISEPVRKRLRLALLDEHDLLDSIRRQEHRPVPGQPGSYACRCEVAVRRPMDPETAEIRVLDVVIRQAGDQWLVVGVEGLGEALEE